MDHLEVKIISPIESDNALHNQKKRENNLKCQLLEFILYMYWC